ncbi:MAG: hypothetical protein ACRCVI_00590 [Mycoplasmoidaceae bacterium]
MELRKKIYEFIINSDELKKYNKQKKIIATVSAIISLLCVFIVVLNFFFAKDVGNALLITAAVIMIFNIIFLFLGIQFFVNRFKKAIYAYFNKNIKEYIEIKNDSNIIISDRIEQYNYRKTIVTLLADDLEMKLKKLIDLS